MKFVRSLQSNTVKLSFILLVVVLDVVFVGINYVVARSSLYDGLLDRAEANQKEVQLTLRLTYMSMMQMALFISNDEALNRLFLAGAQALADEGGGAGGERTAALRNELLAKVKPAWDEITAQFNVRQLHYHLGPGSLSYLRVHSPQKFGDRLDDLRFTIVDTNAQRTPRTGFETGRVYSGLRGVAPVWAEDPQTGESVYVGALEVGTSFNQILPLLSELFDLNVSVLLTSAHVEAKMWPEFINDFLSGQVLGDFYIEASTLSDVQILHEVPAAALTRNNHIELVPRGERVFSAYSFPLRDYQGEINPALPDVGRVVLWQDVTEAVSGFHRDTVINVSYGLVGFILVVAGMFWLVDRETRLLRAEHEAERDGLTGLYNRRYYDAAYAREIARARRQGTALSIIVCDVDFFKKFNDHYGHQQGDDCLISLARLMSSHIKRDSDVVARYGGEEFVFLLPDTTHASALQLAETVRRAVLSMQIPHAESGISEWVTMSFGVACSTQTDTRETLFEVADARLYQAKQTGRNRVCCGQADIEIPARA